MINKRFPDLRLFLSFIILIVVFSFSSCKPSIPSDILSEGEMEDILFDYHLAQASASVTGNSSITCRAYKDVVLKDHGVSSAEFDSSLVYYSRHTDLMHNIYKNLEERLTNEAEQLGASINDINKFGSQMAKGDTADIWAGDKSIVLSPASPFNEYSFSFVADTAFHKGDRVLLDFNTQFIYQDGMRSGMVVLAVTFKNDSVAQQYMQVSNSQTYTLSIDDRDSLGVKNIKGFFLLGKGNNNADNATTLKLMFVTNIRLIRMHVKGIKVGDKMPNQQQQVPQQMPNRMSQQVPPGAVPSGSNGVQSAPVPNNAGQPVVSGQPVNATSTPHRQPLMPVEERQQNVNRTVKSR